MQRDVKIGKNFLSSFCRRIRETSVRRLRSVADAQIENHGSDRALFPQWSNIIADMAIGATVVSRGG